MPMSAAPYCARRSACRGVTMTSRNVGPVGADDELARRLGLSVGVIPRRRAAAGFLRRFGPSKGRCVMPFKMVICVRKTWILADSTALRPASGGGRLCSRAGSVSLSTPWLNRPGGFGPFHFQFQEHCMKPEITVATSDLERLEGPIKPPTRNRSDLDGPACRTRPRQHPRYTDGMPADVIMMNSRARFREERPGPRIRTHPLAWPHEANAADGKVSIFSPAGSALLACRSASSIDWQTPLATRSSCGCWR